MEATLSKPVREYNFAVDTSGRIGFTPASFGVTPTTPAPQRSETTTQGASSVPPRSHAPEQSHAAISSHAAHNPGETAHSLHETAHHPGSPGETAHSSGAELSSSTPGHSGRSEKTVVLGGGNASAGRGSRGDDAEVEERVSRVSERAG